MKILNLSLLFNVVVIVLNLFLVSCKDEKKTDAEVNNIQHAELEKINTLMRDPNFTESMAKALDSSYYVGVQQEQPVFLTPADDTAVILKTLTNEKIAMNLAGFYALECGIGLLSSKTNQTPVALLEKITSKTIDSGSVLILNRFANATWKAGQPFRDLTRISRPNFIIASSLSREEIDKDYYQIFHSAEKLLSSMKPVSNKPIAEQMDLLRKLLQDTLYAREITSYLYSSHDTNGTQKRGPYLTPADDTSRVIKTVKQMKIATSIAGFYALECALNYLATTRHEQPSAILQSLVNNTLSAEDKMLFARFANATWKAGQPFRDLNRITRATFTAFYFLSEEDIEKDMVQIRAAASRLLSVLVSQ